MIQDMEIAFCASIHPASMLHGKRQRLRLAQRLHTYLHDVILSCPLSAKASAMQSFVEKIAERFLPARSDRCKASCICFKPFAYPHAAQSSSHLMCCNHFDEHESSAMLQSEQIHAVIQAYVQA